MARPGDGGEAAGEDLDTLRAKCARAEQRAEGFARMFHDVRNLVGSVSGLTAIVLAGDLQDVQRHHVKRIRASAASLERLVNGALDLSKLEYGLPASESTAFDLRRKLEDVAGLAAERARAKGLLLVTAVDPSVPTALRGDPARLEQLLLNLVVNAVRFTERGSVTLLARSCQRHDGGGVGDLTIEVADTGVGMAPETVERIFEPYRQGEASAASASGTGLGLAIVRSLATTLGGRVSCSSELGRGSTFQVVLPFALRDAGPLRRVDLGAKRILLAESHPASRRDLARETRELGVEVVEADSDAAAARALASAAASGRRIDIVVVGGDLFRNGPALLDQLRGGERTKVVLLDDPGHDISRERAGLITDTVARPVRLAGYLAALEGCVVEREETIAPPAARPTTGGRRATPLTTRAVHVAPVRPPTNRGGVTASIAPPTAAGEPRILALLVEDDDLSAEIATFHLRRRGVDVERAPNGQVAVEMASRARYDVVFMDWHTPKLDGIAATRFIRASEDSGHRTPIVALTAHGSPSARDQCLAAGMDDFLTKPIVGPELERVLTTLRGGAFGRPAAPSEVIQAAPAVDRSRLALLGGFGDLDLAARFAKIFLSSAPTRVADMRTAVTASDHDGLARAAHSLAGMSSQIGADRLSQSCVAVERMATARVLHGGGELLKRVERHLEEVHAELAERFQLDPPRHARAS